MCDELSVVNCIISAGHWPNGRQLSLLWSVTVTFSKSEALILMTICFANLLQKHCRIIGNVWLWSATLPVWGALSKNDTYVLRKLQSALSIHDCHLKLIVHALNRHTRAGWLVPYNGTIMWQRFLDDGPGWYTPR